MVEDQTTERIFHHEVFVVTKKMVSPPKGYRGDYDDFVPDPIVIAFIMPVYEPLPPQYYVRIVHDTYHNADDICEVNVRDLVLPNMQAKRHTELLDLDPLPLTAVLSIGKDIGPRYYNMHKERFSHFNPIQAQVFHTMAHTAENVFLGAPTGSGKTICAELAILQLLAAHGGKRKAVYIAPLKALVRERVDDWRRTFCRALGVDLVELTGDFTPDMKSLLKAHIVVTTPEKWDSITRGWSRRAYVQTTGLLIFDEVHLLGGDRGPVLEMLVSRTRRIAHRYDTEIRFVGLSTALSSADDVCDWLGVRGAVGRFNFKPSVRPIPLEAHIQGHPGKAYCPRMLAMNKPTYQAIRTYAPDKPTLVFVSSRRQTRLTALDLITFAMRDGDPHVFSRGVKGMDKDGRGDLEADENIALLSAAAEPLRDESLRHTIAHGIGLHHAGLCESDRTTVEELFRTGRIQVLVSTSTLA